MRAITVRQPWAYAIVHLGKDVENRSRDFTGGYRGTIAVHASKTVDEGGFDAVSGILDLDFEQTCRIAEQCQGTLGAIIGVVELVDVHHGPGVDHKPPICWRAADMIGWVPFDGTDAYPDFTPRMCSEWAQPGQYHLELANPRPLATPVPCRGALGLWTVPDEIAAQMVVVGGAPC